MKLNIQKLNFHFSGGMITTFFIALLLTSCNLQKSNPLNLEAPITPEGRQTDKPDDIPKTGEDVVVIPGKQITFNVIMDQVLYNHCNGCHSVDGIDGGNAGGVNLDTYENVLKELQAIRSTVISRDMPPRKYKDIRLSDAQIKLIVDWIDAGAKENGDDTLNPPVDQPPVVIPPIVGEAYFAEVNEYVLKTNCLSCHSTAKSIKGDVNLDNYEAVIHNLKAVKDSIVDDFMPPKRRGIPLTEQQKKLILDWIEAGAKEKASEAVVPPVVAKPPTTTH